MYFIYVHIYRSEVQIEEDMFKSLFDGAGISMCGAYCAIMEFKRMCRIPFTAIAALLQLLQLLCPPDNKLLGRCMCGSFSRGKVPSIPS